MHVIDLPCFFSSNIMQQLEGMRTLLHSVFHNLLKNVESRNGVLMYFSAILKHNDKRTQFHADDKTLARDGFMMNVMCVLQKLSVKIKLERVDPMYPFHWESMINISKDTKLRYDETEYKEWTDQLSKFSDGQMNRFQELSVLMMHLCRKWFVRRQMGTSKFPNSLLVSYTPSASFGYHAGHSTLQQTSQSHQGNSSHVDGTEQHEISMGEFGQCKQK